MWTVGEVVNALITFCNSLRKLIQVTLWLSFSVGGVIVEFITFVLFHVGNVLITLFVVLQVLYEDFIVFIIDCSWKLKSAASTLLYFWSQILLVSSETYQIARRTAVSLHDFVVSCVSVLWSCLNKLHGFIIFVPELLKEAIILIGSSVWYCVQFVPLCIVYCMATSVYAVGRCYEELTSIVSAAYDGINTILWSVLLFFTDIPSTALLGLLIAVFLSVALIKYQAQIFSFALSIILCTFNFLRSLPVRILKVLLSTVRRTVIRRQSETNVSSDESDISEQSSYSMQSQQPVSSRLRPAVKLHSTEASSSKDDLIKRLQREQDSRLCVVCQDRDKCIVVLPCQHLCLCVQCATTVHRENGKCPICRQPLRKAMKVYVS
ncbi:uncharacterized protein LOC126343848 [Schistocerca gregaria]|uniref:uncharacterized protein LOC126343848 n=1 Tax=Schistocerca gregaria TaxID=7010 RepID=UPI00211E4C4D|nr:uncharacterized protein LOC126343848 [Schistocerca gregaria]